jgi:hypothetical protein
VERLIVEGTQLGSVGYNARKNDLEIEFKDGSVTLYMGVPAPIYLALMNAEDKDAYYNKHVKDIFINWRVL